MAESKDRRDEENQRGVPVLMHSLQYIHKEPTRVAYIGHAS